jgi:hypothetical protein
MKARKKPTKKRKSEIAADVVQARAFVLADESDRVRASLFCSGGPGRDGCVGLHLNDGAGRPRIALLVRDNNEVGVTLFTQDNGLGVSIGLSNSGHGISIQGFDGKAGIISLGFASPASNDPRGSGPRIDVLDTAQQRSWSVFDGIVKHPRKSARK